jgi:hypothetical protein
MCNRVSQSLPGTPTLSFAYLSAIINVSLLYMNASADYLCITLFVNPEGCTKVNRGSIILQNIAVRSNERDSQDGGKDTRSVG